MRRSSDTIEQQLIEWDRRLCSIKLESFTAGLKSNIDRFIRLVCIEEDFQNLSTFQLLTTETYRSMNQKLSENIPHKRQTEILKRKGRFLTCSFQRIADNLDFRPLNWLHWLEQIFFYHGLLHSSFPIRWKLKQFSRIWPKRVGSVLRSSLWPFVPQSYALLTVPSPFETELFSSETPAIGILKRFLLYHKYKRINRVSLHLLSVVFLVSWPFQKSDIFGQLVL